MDGACAHLTTGGSTSDAWTWAVKFTKPKGHAPTTSSLGCFKCVCLMPHPHIAALPTKRSSPCPKFCIKSKVVHGCWITPALPLLRREQHVSSFGYIAFTRAFLLVLANTVLNKASELRAAHVFTGLPKARTLKLTAATGFVCMTFAWA